MPTTGFRKILEGALLVGALPLAALAQERAAPAAPAAEASWYPSKWGKDDTLGALNELSPAKVLEAARLVKTGKTYALGVEVSSASPAYPPRTFQIFTVPSGDGTGTPLGTNKATGNDDLVLTWVGIGSQLDGLGHLGIDHRYYNGVAAADLMRADGLAKYGTHLIPPIVTRGVLLDIAKLKGTKQLAGGTAIGPAEIEAARAKQNVEIRAGDVVLLHTGWLPMAERDPKKFMETEPGLGVSGAEHLSRLGVVAVGADCWGVEVLPFEHEGQVFPVHQILLAKNGIYILENIDTAELAADGASEFLFVLGFPKWKGAVQAMINPVAIR
jgi:kynurenine formamidase